VLFENEGEQKKHIIFLRDVNCELGCNPRSWAKTLLEFYLRSDYKILE